MRIGILFISLLLLSCKSKTTTQQPEVQKQGVYCYQSSDESSVFMKLNFYEEGEVEGEFLFNDNDYGKVFYFFHGTFSNDTILNVDIYFPLDLLSQEWNISMTENGVILKGIFFESMNLTDFNKIDCSKFPDMGEYRSIQEAYEEGGGEEGYYDSDDDVSDQPYYYVNKSVEGTNKEVSIYEYIQLWVDDEKVYGRGAGTSEGHSEWTFNFHGKKAGDNKFDVTVSYTRGSDGFKLNETWSFSEPWNKIQVLQNGDKRPGGGYLIQTFVEFVPDEMIILFSEEELTY